MITRALVDGVVVHETGGARRVRQFNGLLDTPGPKQERFDRPRGHGSVDYSEFTQGKTVEINGLIVKDTAAQAMQDYDTLRALWGLNGSDRVLRFRREGMSEDEQVAFRLNGPISADLQNFRFVRYATSLFVPDPRIYTTAFRQAFYEPNPGAGGGLIFPLSFPLSFHGGSVLAQSLSFTVGGTAATPPVFTILGPITDGAIVDVDTAETLQLNGTVQQGEILVIDVGRRKVTLDGTERFDFVDPSTNVWIEFKPGQRRLQLTGDAIVAGSTRLAVAWREARS